MINLVNGEYVETEEMQYEDQETVQTDTQRVNQLAVGLSTATSLAQVRDAAKAVLNETEGTE